jgi:RHS repeat-associated protein
VFEEGSFRPAAKLTKDKKYSIVTDYLGTPAQMYDEKGQVVWETHLDIYGKVRTFAGRSLSDCPFRYQGQYEDAETGLYYNRFRYYSPEEGTYLSQDPIGLAGNNPTLYGYVSDTNSWLDIFGLIIVYRGERSSMTPDKVFQNGFTPKGSHDDLLAHVTSNTTAGNFVSSSSKIDIAEGFAGKNGYVYMIQTENVIDVNEVLGSQSPFPGQFEYSIKGGVRGDEVVGVYKIKNGKMTGEFIPNPNHKSQIKCG